MLGPLGFLQISRHFRLVLLGKKRFVIGLRLIVVARNLGELLLHHGRHVQTRLVLIDFRLTLFYLGLAVGDLQAIGLELAFHFEQRCALWVKRFDRGSILCRILGFSRLVGHDALPRIFEQRDLLFGLAHVGILIRVMR